jgi:predicted MFS family arabinose efflux permease
VITAAAVVGLDFGQPLSLLLENLFSWRGVFLINIPLCIALLIAGYFVFPRDRYEKVPRKVDIFGGSSLQSLCI